MNFNPWCTQIAKMVSISLCFISDPGWDQPRKCLCIVFNFPLSPITGTIGRYLLNYPQHVRYLENHRVINGSTCVLQYTLARPDRLYRPGETPPFHWQALSTQCDANTSLRFSVRGVEAGTQCTTPLSIRSQLTANIILVPGYTG